MKLLYKVHTSRSSSLPQKHLSLNAPSVVPPLILWLCDMWQYVSFNDGGKPWLLTKGLTMLKVYGVIPWQELIPGFQPIYSNTQLRLQQLLCVQLIFFALFNRLSSSQVTEGQIWQKNSNNDPKSQIWRNSRWRGAIRATRATKYEFPFQKHKRTVGAIITIRKSTSVICPWTIFGVALRHQRQNSFQVHRAEARSFPLSGEAGQIGRAQKNSKRPQISDVWRYPAVTWLPAKWPGAPDKRVMGRSEGSRRSCQSSTLDPAAFSGDEDSPSHLSAWASAAVRGSHVNHMSR